MKLHFHPKGVYAAVGDTMGCGATLTGNMPVPTDSTNLTTCGNCKRSKAFKAGLISDAAAVVKTMTLMDMAGAINGAFTFNDVLTVGIDGIPARDYVFVDASIVAVYLTCGDVQTEVSTRAFYTAWQAGRVHPSVTEVNDNALTVADDVEDCSRPFTTRGKVKSTRQARRFRKGA